MTKPTQALVKCEMHLHSLGGSSCAHVSPADIAKTYSDAGYRAIVVTNHYNKWAIENHLPAGTAKQKASYYIDAYKDVSNCCAKYGIHVFFGMELTTHRPERVGRADILLYGVTEDFLYEHPHLCDYSDEDLYSLTNSAGILCYQAHPFRESCYLHDLKYLDGIEVYNGHPYHEPHLSRTQQYAIEHGKLLVSGSDFHDLYPDNLPNTITGGIMIPANTTSITQLVEYLKQSPPLIMPAEYNQDS